MDDSVFFLRVVECIENTQIIHMEETGITQRAIGLKTKTMTKNKIQNQSFSLFSL
jgi:hypothetical protein